MTHIHRFKRLIIVTAAILSLCMLSCSDRQKDIADSGAKEKAQEEALRLAVQAFARDSGADTSWRESIIKKHSRCLYSIDLEAVWLIGKPILFIGTLENVATCDDINYQLLIRASRHSPELKLELLCPKQKVYSIIKAIKNDPDTFFGVKIAVAAKVTQVEYRLQPAKEGMERVFLGHGNCLNIMYLGNTFEIRLSNEDPL